MPKDIKIWDQKLSRPSNKRVSELKKRRLEELEAQANMIDDRTILGKLRKQKLRHEYTAERDDLALEHNKKVLLEGDFVPTILPELTEYGKISNAINVIEQSGIKEIIDDCRFDNFTTNETFQKQLKEKAMHYANDPKGWFTVMGQSGCGKTHICTALAAEIMIRHGMSLKYMLWNNEVNKMKSNWETQSKKINKVKEAEVLYIDDFFKTDTRTKPTEADVRIAFEILNYRYARKLPTIISTEKTPVELIEIDRAIAGRIRQMSKVSDNYIPIEHSDKRDWRQSI